MAKKPPAPPPPDRAFDVERIGIRRSLAADLFHTLMTASWWRLIGAGFVAWMLLNFVFALLFMLDPDGITNAPEWSLPEHFAFAVQTSATIGYGGMTPGDLYENTLVAVLSFLSTMYTACLTGVVVAKFARPTARVLYSRHLTLAERGGKRTLQLRMANERGNAIVEARARVSMLRDEVSPEGERMRRIHDLGLLRSETPGFALTWLVVHPIDEKSPLHGMTAADLEKCNATFMVTLTGLDDTLGQTVHSRKSYSWRDIAWHHRFADVISDRPGGGRRIDYTKFHDLEPLPEARAEEAS